MRIPQRVPVDRIPALPGSSTWRMMCLPRRRTVRQGGHPPWTDERCSARTAALSAGSILPAGRAMAQTWSPELRSYVRGLQEREYLRLADALGLGSARKAYEKLAQRPMPSDLEQKYGSEVPADAVRRSLPLSGDDEDLRWPGSGGTGSRHPAAAARFSRHACLGRRRGAHRSGPRDRNADHLLRARRFLTSSTSPR